MPLFGQAARGRRQAGDEVRFRLSET